MLSEDKRQCPYIQTWEFPRTSKKTFIVRFVKHGSGLLNVVVESQSLELLKTQVVVAQNILL